MNNFMPGDILFYTSLPNDIYDVAITNITRSRYVHTAIAISAIQKIEALSRGIVITPLDNRAVAAAWSYTGTIKDYNINSLHNALNWLISQKGNVYGWGDAANAMIQAAGFNLAINEGDHYDCSSLATEFLKSAGGLSQLNGIDPHKVTPAMLSKLLNIA